MKISSTSHIPLVELTIQHRFLYWLAAYSAILRVRPWPLTNEEFITEFARIWDEQKFAPADAVNFAEMAERLESLLARYAVNDQAAWVPEGIMQRVEAAEMQATSQRFASFRSRAAGARRARRRHAYTGFRVRPSR